MDFLTERAFVGVVATLIVLGLFVFLCRPRKAGTVHDAVLDTVQRLSKAAPELRNGLTEQAADQATTHLLEMLKCVAVGISDRDGRLLSWDGQANEHYADLEEQIVEAVREGHRAHVQHENLQCRRRGSCPMRTAVIVPLIIDGQVEGALIVVGGVDGKRMIRAADEVARFLCIQLELAKLDESKQQLAQAELRALRAQISPHFIYNTLNTISSLIRTDPEQSRELLQDFAAFTRYSFRSNGMFATLADELSNIDRYLTIECARYGERLNVRLRIAPEVQSVVVPFLVLQPLVENAVRHGIAKKPGGGTVSVFAHDNGNEALITIEDDGVGMDADRLFEDLRDAHKSGAHVGVGNINYRMRQVFGDDYALMVETAPGAGMKVTLRVPKYFPGVRPDLPNFAGDDHPDDDSPNGQLPPP
ncbi:GAF domain-containing sensor histidine kinase [Actinokineospora globicatena]|uniref:Histidine kinase n=1 Tax=Actinokineospora globicatena TaxID=103729 RepID=A0A9W6QP04_9PSEU|nr:histidine kinase [Actinokineospora globicatena]MCP2301189.1 two-component system, LytT family, sensor kinase [Actinokineospora globicatena]GLW77175.1 histidine kinase [Actinokineospora globicatena]GLW84009.1 histidine kinase [Actinokineospora globicatena]GLW92047.1 histidine kinase [Actinokineospora globicatena]